MHSIIRETEILVDAIMFLFHRYCGHAVGSTSASDVLVVITDVSTSTM